MIFERAGLAGGGRRPPASCCGGVHWVDGRLRRTSRDGRGRGRAGHPGGLRGARPGLRTARGRRRGPSLAGSRADELLGGVMHRSSTTATGFFDTAADAERLYARPQDPTDNATPSGLSAAVHALRAAGRADRGERVRGAGRAGRGTAPARWLARAPRFAGWLLADAISRRSVRVAPVAGGDRRDARGRRPGRAGQDAHRRAPAGSVIMAGAPDPIRRVSAAARPTDSTAGRPPDGVRAVRLRTVVLPVYRPRADLTDRASERVAEAAQLARVDDQRDRDVVADEAGDRAGVEDLVEAEPGR